MSQQKVLLTVCLVAGLIGAAYGQSNLSINPAACGQNAQAIVNKYLQSMSSTTQEAIQELQQMSNGAVDIQGITNEANNVMQQYSQVMGNPSQSYSLDNYMQLFSGIAASQAKLAGRIMNLGLGSQGVTIYMKFMSTSVSQYTSMVSQVAQACTSSQTQ